MKIQEAGWASAHHRSRVVASCFDCGDTLGEQLIPFALPLLQLLDALENARPELGHVQVRPQRFLGRPHLEFYRADIAPKELHNVLWFLPTRPTL
jgi:hypothetical protein